MAFWKILLMIWICHSNCSGSFQNKIGRSDSEEITNSLDSQNIWVDFVGQVIVSDPTVNKCLVSLKIVSRNYSSQIINLAAFLNREMTRYYFLKFES